MKKYLTDNFGYTLRNIRENLKFTQTEVFQGILTSSTWCNYESGIMIPDMVTFITLLERMGVSPDRFEFIVPEEVNKFYEWYEDCLIYIENNDWKSLVEQRNKFEIFKQINLKIQYQYRDFIDYVIERFANKNLERALHYIKTALAQTVKNIDKIAANKRLLSIFEGHILNNYYDLLYEMGRDDSEELYSLYEYFSNKLQDDLIQCKILPRMAMILLKNDRDVLSREDRLKIEHKTLRILVKNCVIREVPEILKYLIKDEMSYGLSKIRIFQRNALVEVFNKYGVCSEFRVELQRFERKKYLLLADVLRLRRMELGLTIEDVADGICAVSTYARAENGKTTPNRTTLAMIKERLKLRAIYYRSEIEVEDYSLLVLNSEYRRLAAVGRYSEAELIHKELFKKLDMAISVNRQIMGFFELYKLSDKMDKISKLWELLSYDEVNVDKRILFSREEIEILSLIAWENVQISEKGGIEFLESIIEKEGRQRRTYYSRTAIIERDLIKLLKNNKEYERSYKLAITAIDKMFLENETGLLLDILDFISTIEEDLGNKTEASKICEEMFYIAELYEMYNHAQSIRTYYDEIFNKDKIWY